MPCADVRADDVALRLAARGVTRLDLLAVACAKRLDAEHSLEELAGLVDAAGASVAFKVIQERPTPDPATFIGSGKLDELAKECARLAIDLVVFDNELSPAQLRQIEERVDRKVIDRTQLILDIFARRARSNEEIRREGES